MQRGGEQPTTTKWVDGWKEDGSGERVVRCRLVGRDFKESSGADRSDLFAAMPPLEAKKLVFRMVAGVRRQRRRRMRKEEIKLMFIDVLKAHLNAICEEEEWVELLEEFWKWCNYATLKRWLYGMRKAAAGWEDDDAAKLEGEGFRIGKGAPTVFWNERTGVPGDDFTGVVHGGDFTFCGVKKDQAEDGEVVRYHGKRNNGERSARGEGIGYIGTHRELD